MVTRLVGIFSLSGTTPPPFQIKLQILLVPCREELLISPSGHLSRVGNSLLLLGTLSLCRRWGPPVPLLPSPQQDPLLTSTAKVPPMGNTTPGDEV